MSKLSKAIRIRRAERSQVVANAKPLAIAEVVYVNLRCPWCANIIANNEKGENIYLHDLRTIYPTVHCLQCDLHMAVSKELLINHDPR